MRLVPLVALTVLLAACAGEGERHIHEVSLEGQSPPPPPPPPPSTLPAEPPPASSVMADSPAWLRANLAMEWTAPPGWDIKESTKPNRLMEVTLEQNGPGGGPVQFLILKGGDDQPDPMKLKTANFSRWEANFHEDAAPQTTNPDHDGLKITRIKVHGAFEGAIFGATSVVISEAGWTMIGGWVEAPNGSILYRMQGPDAIMKANESKLDQWLASLRPRQPK